MSHLRAYVLGLVGFVLIVGILAQGGIGSLTDLLKGSLFSIPPQTQTIQIISPKAGDVYKPGDTIKIEWTTGTLLFQPGSLQPLPNSAVPTPPKTMQIAPAIQPKSLSLRPDRIALVQLAPINYGKALPKATPAPTAPAPAPKQLAPINYGKATPTPTAPVSAPKQLAPTNVGGTSLGRPVDTTVPSAPKAPSTVTMPIGPSNPQFQYQGPTSTPTPPSVPSLPSSSAKPILYTVILTKLPTQTTPPTATRMPETSNEKETQLNLTTTGSTSYVWTTSTNFIGKFKISIQSSNGKSGIMNGFFEIKNPSTQYAVTSPAPNSSYNVGDTISFQWQPLKPEMSYYQIYLRTGQPAQPGQYTVGFNIPGEPTTPPFNWTIPANTAPGPYTAAIQGCTRTADGGSTCSDLLWKTAGQFEIKKSDSTALIVAKTNSSYSGTFAKDTKDVPALEFNLTAVGSDITITRLMIRSYTNNQPTWTLATGDNGEMSLASASKVGLYEGGTILSYPSNQPGRALVDNNQNYKWDLGEYSKLYFNSLNLKIAKGTTRTITFKVDVANYAPSSLLTPYYYLAYDLVPAEDIDAISSIPTRVVSTSPALNSSIDHNPVLTILTKPIEEQPVAVNCGNGIVDGAEQCDDGNNLNGDGCSANCVKVNLPTGTISLSQNESGTLELNGDKSFVEGGQPSGATVSGPYFSDNYFLAGEYTLAITPPAGFFLSTVTNQANDILKDPPYKQTLLDGGTLVYNVTYRPVAQPTTLNIKTSLPNGQYAVSANGNKVAFGSGDSATTFSLPEGSYMVTFGAIAGYQTPEAITTPYLQGGSVFDVFGGYEAPQIQTGTLNIKTSLGNGEYAVSDFKGNKIAFGSGDSATTFSLPEGSYTVTFGAVAGYLTPEAATKYLQAGSSIDVFGGYEAY